MSRRKGCGFVGRNWPIVGFVGPNGGGKTLAMMVTMGIPAMDAGIPVLSNFRLMERGWDGFVDYPHWEPLTNWQQLLDFQDGVILLDEVSSWVPSRESSKLPPGVLSELNQMRKANRRVGWAGPAWGRCDKALREVTQAVCWCRGHMEDKYRRDQSTTHRFPATGRRLYDDDGKALLVDGWEDRRLFHWSWYDPYGLPEDPSAQDLDNPPAGVKTKQTRWYWRPGHDDHRRYDTREKVLMLDTVDPSGACLTCGGNRPRRQCRCDGHNAEVLSRRAA